MRHEGAAAFAASGHAKLTGRPAACFAIAGPGATNLLTGLWDAHVDRVPVVALTGQVDVQVLGPGAFQEVDLAAAFESVAAWSQTGLPGSDHAELASLAVKHATIGRGVGHLIVPAAVQTLPVAVDAPAGSPVGRVGSPHISPEPAALAAAADELASWARPLIIVGHGARFAVDEVCALDEALDVPVATTFKGKGLIADNHPLAAGVLGRSGTPVASWMMNEASGLLVLGASFSNHTGISAKKPIIQIDSDPMARGRFHAVTHPILGELGRTCVALQALVHGRLQVVDQRSELAARWAIWREEKRRRREDDRGRGVNSAASFDALGRLAPDDASFAVDVGNNTYAFGRYLEASGAQAVLMSGYLGSIGFGYPAAMGAWAAEHAPSVRDHPPRKIIAVTGDGGVRPVHG